MVNSVFKTNAYALAVLYIVFASPIDVFGFQTESSLQIRNGNIDNTEYWTTLFDANCVFDKETGFSTKGSLLIDNNPKGTELEFGQIPFGRWSQVIETPDDLTGNLKVTAHFKAKDFDGFANARLVAVCIRNDGAHLSYARGEYLSKNSDWKQVSIVFRPPEETSRISLEIHMTGSGRVWLDDFELTETEEPLTQVPFPRPPEANYWSDLRKSANEISWQFDLEEAQQKSRDSGKPLLVYIRSVEARDKGLKSAQTTLEATSVWAMEDGYQKDVMFRTGVVSIPEISELVSRRFIPLLLTYNFERDLEKKILPGITGNDVVPPSIVIFAANGNKVAHLHRVGVFSIDMIDQWLRDSLDASAAKFEASAGPLDAFWDGQLEQFLDDTAHDDTEEVRILRSRAWTRLGQLDRATVEIKDVDSASASLQRAIIEMRKGSWSQALKHLDKIQSDDDGNKEVIFRKAWCLHRTGQKAEAFKLWHSIRGDDTIGRRAIACLTPGQNAKLWMIVSERLWPREQKLPPHTEFGTENQFSPIDSVNILLELQRSDGSWSFNETGALWSGAMTALGAEALRIWRDELPVPLREKVDKAHQRAVAYLEKLVLRTPTLLDTFNYTYMLDHFLKIDKLAEAQKIVEHLESLQKESGAWSYRHDCVTSFNTADVIVALCKAKSAGLKVSKERLAKGAEALRDMRSAYTKGNFPYSPHRNFQGLARSDPQGSIARNPICEYALIVAGVGSKPNHEKALNDFLEYERQLRTPTKMYSSYFNKNSHGSYFFFYGHHNAFQSAKGAAPELQKKVFDAVKRSILFAREKDGSAMDHFMYGRAYGTAFTLVILGQIREHMHGKTSEDFQDQADSIQIHAFWDRFTDSKYAFGDQWETLQQLSPANPSKNYNHRELEFMLPPADSKVGEVWKIEADKFLPLLRQFHPGVTHKLHGSNNRGAFGCVMSVNKNELRVRYRVHAEIRLEDGIYMPSQFSGDVIWNRKSKKILAFRLAVPPRRNNVAVEWRVVTGEGEDKPKSQMTIADIGFCSRMELANAYGTRFEKTTWLESLTHQQVDDAFRKEIYAFAEINWLPWEQAVAESRKTGKSLHVVALFGPLDDEAC